MSINLSKNSLNDLTNFLWQDLRAPESSLRQGSAAPDLITLFGSGNLRGYGFNGVNTEEMLEGTLQFPHA